jgi:hypothetical protein
LPALEHDIAMTAIDAARMYVTIHLMQQTTVVFDADDLWPKLGAVARSGNDLPSFAEEVARRLHADGYVGYSNKPDNITVIPLGSVKRVDFSIMNDGSSPR